MRILRVQKIGSAGGFMLFLECGCMVHLRNGGERPGGNWRCSRHEGRRGSSVVASREELRVLGGDDMEAALRVGHELVGRVLKERAS